MWPYDHVINTIRIVSYKNYQKIISEKTCAWRPVLDGQEGKHHGVEPGGPGRVATAFMVSHWWVAPSPFYDHNIQYGPMAFTTQLGFGRGCTAGMTFRNLFEDICVQCPGSQVPSKFMSKL